MTEDLNKEMHDWKPATDLRPDDKLIYINLRCPPEVTPTLYRWLPYPVKTDDPAVPKGRWQIITDQGWKNIVLPPQGEWIVHQSLG